MSIVPLDAVLCREMRRCLGTSLLSFGLDIGCSNHFGPLLRFFSDQLSEVAGRAVQWHSTKIGESRAELGIGKARIDLLVELLDDVGGGALGRACTIPGT